MTNQKVKRMESMEAIEIIPPDIKNLIYVVRNKQVMVDSDLAILYQIETKALNRAVKRNIKRFSEDFCFQLTTENARVRKKRMDEEADVHYHMYSQDKEYPC